MTTLQAMLHRLPTRKGAQPACKQKLPRSCETWTCNYPNVERFKCGPPTGKAWDSKNAIVAQRPYQHRITSIKINPRTICELPLPGQAYELISQTSQCSTPRQGRTTKHPLQNLPKSKFNSVHPTFAHVKCILFAASGRQNALQVSKCGMPTPNQERPHPVYNSTTPGNDRCQSCQGHS